MQGLLAAMIVAFENPGRPAGGAAVRVVLMAVGARSGRSGDEDEVGMASGRCRIVGESTLLEPEVAHKGFCAWRWRSGQGSPRQRSDAGVNAVVAMAPVIAALDRSPPRSGCARSGIRGAPA